MPEGAVPVFSRTCRPGTMVGRMRSKDSTVCPSRFAWPGVSGLGCSRSNGNSVLRPSGFSSMIGMIANAA